MIAGIAMAVALVAGGADQDMSMAAVPSAHVTRTAVQASVLRRVALPDMSAWDPENPPAAWLDKMVRPCVRSGSRLTC